MRLGAAALFLLSPFLLLLLGLVLPPTEDTHWRKIDISAQVGEVEVKGFSAMNLFNYRAEVDGSEDVEASLLGDDDQAFCSDANKASFGDECCEPFRTSQALAITATSLSGAALVALVVGIVADRMTRMVVGTSGALSFAAGVIGTTLVILYDTELSEPLCGSGANPAFKGVEYGPLFYLATAGSILAVLSGVALFFVRTGGSSSSSSGGGSTDFNKRVGAAAAPSSSETSANTFPGSLIF